jgi:hypothetical protein
MLAIADTGALVEDSHERLKAPALFEQMEISGPYSMTSAAYSRKSCSTRS